MYDKRVYLKVKIKSLAAEAKIIRTEERRNKYLRNGLTEHRKGIVRSEARHTLLAYGFLRGRSYEQLELSCDTKPNWQRVQKMVEKYGIYFSGNYSSDKKYGWYRLAKQEEIKHFKKWRGQTFIQKVLGR